MIDFDSISLEELGKINKYRPVEEEELISSGLGYFHDNLQESLDDIIQLKKDKNKKKKEIEIEKSKISLNIRKKKEVEFKGMKDTEGSIASYVTSHSSIINLENEYFSIEQNLVDVEKKRNRCDCALEVLKGKKEAMTKILKWYELGMFNIPKSVERRKEKDIRKKQRERLND
ncbi:MAG: hypothetical protein GY679_02115 [Mycoplasma sp.]|nr:hypothetical protein [Mycoplasma sp.]